MSRSLVIGALSQSRALWALSLLAKRTKCDFRKYVGQSRLCVCLSVYLCAVQRPQLRTNHCELHTASQIYPLVGTAQIGSTSIQGQGQSQRNCRYHLKSHNFCTSQDRDIIFAPTCTLWASLSQSGNNRWPTTYRFFVTWPQKIKIIFKKYCSSIFRRLSWNWAHMYNYGQTSYIPTLVTIEPILATWHQFICNNFIMGFSIRDD